MSENEDSLRSKVTKQGEEALGKLAQDLLQSPVVTSTLTVIFETRERAGRVQEVAMAVLNLPSATDLERLTRRLRSVSQRIEGIEDGLDGVAQRLDGLTPDSDVDQRLSAIEASLTRIEQALPQTEETCPPVEQPAASEAPAGPDGTPL